MELVDTMRELIFDENAAGTYAGEEGKTQLVEDLQALMEVRTPGELTEGLSKIASGFVSPRIVRVLTKMGK